MPRPLVSILGVLVLLAAATAGLNAQTASPTGDTAPGQTGAAAPAAVVSDQPSLPVEGGQPFDPAALRPDQPYPGTGYPWERAGRPVPSERIVAPPPGVDLDVTFINRAPMYRSYCVDYPNGVPGVPTLCPGTEDERHWPAAGKVVTFTAHIANKGTLPSPTYDFKWFIDGSQVASGTLPGLGAGAETTTAYHWPWAHRIDGERVLDDHTVRFVIDPGDAVAETFEANNSLEDRTNALGFRIGHQSFNAPRGVAANRIGNLVVANTGNRQIVTLPGAVPTLTPTPAPACQELVTNGGFEEDAAWDFPATASRGGYTTVDARTGARSARLGLLPGQDVTPDLTGLRRPVRSERNPLGEQAPENASFSAADQTISIPANAGSVGLTFRYRPGSEAATGGDYQRVMLLDPDGYTYIAALMQVLENADSWRRATFDLTPYRGRQIILYFEVFNDNISAGPRSWMYVDDVSVQVCGVTPPPPETPTPTPSPTPEGDLTVTGLVYDASLGRQRPIGGAMVSAQMCVPHSFGTLTGTDGRYSLPVPGYELDACAEITINALAPGYGAEGRRTVVAELRRNPQVDFGLVPLPAISVTTTDDELNADGDCSLREAIQATNTHQPVDACRPGSHVDTITVPAGIYRLTLAGAGEDANRTGDLDITGDLVLAGAGIKGTVIDGAGLDRVLDIHGGAKVDISGVMFSGGRTPDGIDSPSSGGDAAPGGGIANAGDLTLAGCGIAGNGTGDGGNLDGGQWWGGPPGGNGGNGGGIYNTGAVQVYDTWVIDNATGSGGSGGDADGLGLAGAGGGIYNLGKLTLDRATVERNRAGMGGYLVSPPATVGGPGGDGGGIYNAGDAAIVHSSVANNRAGDGHFAGSHGLAGGGGAGGGIFDAGDLLLRQSTVSGNASGAGGGGGNTCGAGGHGGGIAVPAGGSLRLVNSTLSGNRTGDGGTGMWQPRPCASGSGGGIYTAGGFSSDNSTIAANRAGESTSGEGGGIFIADHYTSVRNTILAKNAATGDGQDCQSPLEWPTIHLRGHNLIQNPAGCIAIEYPDAGPGIIGVDPLLQPLGKYGGPTLTHALSPGSPAIDAGSCTDMQGDPVRVDQRGVARPQGETCDIGAFEGRRSTLYLPLVIRARSGLLDLLYFKAMSQNTNAILLEWETAAEPDTVAFSLYRSQDSASLGQLLATLPAQGDGLTGAAYSYRDGGVQPGVLYHYTLAQVTTSGELISVATATAKVGVPTQTPTATRTPSPTLSSTATPTKTPTLTPATGGITDAVWLDANGDGERDVDGLELGSVRLVLR